MTVVSNEGDVISLAMAIFEENGIDFLITDVRDLGIAGY